MGCERIGHAVQAGAIRTKNPWEEFHSLMGLRSICCGVPVKLQWQHSSRLAILDS